MEQQSDRVLYLATYLLPVGDISVPVQRLVVADAAATADAVWRQLEQTLGGIYESVSLNEMVRIDTISDLYRQIQSVNLTTANVTWQGARPQDIPCARLRATVEGGMLTDIESLDGTPIVYEVDDHDVGEDAEGEEVIA